MTPEQELKMLNSKYIRGEDLTQEEIDRLVALKVQLGQVEEMPVGEDGEPD